MGEPSWVTLGRRPVATLWSFTAVYEKEHKCIQTDLACNLGSGMAGKSIKFLD